MVLFLLVLDLAGDGKENAKKCVSRPRAYSCSCTRAYAEHGDLASQHHLHNTSRDIAVGLSVPLCAHTFCSCTVAEKGAASLLPSPTQSISW